MDDGASPGGPGVSEDGEGLPMPRRIWAIIAVSFGTALFVLDSVIANVALPTLSRELDVSEGAVTSVVTIYQLVMVMGLLPFAKLGDRIGHRRIYQIGQVLFCSASALVWFIDSFAMLLVLRALQALGASLALAVASAMIRSEFSNMASVSVGKPAIMSAPNTMSGRSERSFSTTASASSRRCRRFMRFKIMSSPDCSERCRCGIRRWSVTAS